MGESNLYAVDFETQAKTDPVSASAALPETNPYAVDFAEHAQETTLAPGRAAFNATAMDLGPGAAAEALQHAAAGSDATWTAQNLPSVKKAADQARIAAQLRSAPNLAAHMAQGPARAAAAKHDVSRLTFLEWALTGRWEAATEAPDIQFGEPSLGRMVQPPAWLEGLKLGLADIGSALMANKQAKLGSTPEEEAQQKDVEDTLAAGIPDTDTLPRKAFAASARAVPSLVAYGSAAATGAAIGSVGGPIGAAVGAAIGTAGAFYTLGFGPLYRSLKALTGPDDEPLLSDEEAKAWATGGAGLSAAAQLVPASNFLRAIPGVAPALERLGVNAVAKVATDSVARAAARRLMQAGGHVFSGALMMGAQGAIEQAAIEDAKSSHGMDRDWGAIVDKAAEGFKSGLLIAPIAAFEPGRAFLDDLGRIHDSRIESAKLEAMTRIAAGLDLARRAPEQAEQVLAALAGQGGESPTVYISPEKLRSDLQGALEVVVGPEAMAEARTSGGSVAVPIEKYLTHLADQHQALRDDVKLSPDGMTPREAQERIDAFHVSPAQFATFDLSKIGTGTGLASEGWGLYFTSSQDIQHLYAEHLQSLQKPTHLYKVQFPGDIVLMESREKLADQPAKVKAILQKAGLLEGNEQLTAKEFYANVADTPEAASKKLLELGIHGMQFPGELKIQGKPATNFLVWDERKIGIVEPKPQETAAAPSAKAMAEIAAARLEAMRLGDIHPGRYEQDARRAGDKLASVTTAAAEEAVAGARQGFVGAGVRDTGKEQTPTAGQENLREAGKKVSGAESALEGTQALESARDFSRAMQKASTKIATEADKNRKFLLSFTKDDQRAELGKAGQQYLDQVDNLLSGFELGQGASRTDVARRLATMQWMAQEQAAGRDPAIPQSVLDKLDRFVHWKELTPQELRDLRSSVENVAHLAGLKNTLLEKQQRVDRDQAKQELIDGLNANLQRIQVFNDRNAAPPGAKRSAEVGRFKAALVRPEELIREMDGGKVDGPWSRYLWDNLRDGYLRWLDMRRDAAVPIGELVDSMTRGQKRDLKETRFTVDGEEYSLEAALSVALNSGADSNLSKMKRGWSDPRIGRYGLKPWSDADGVHEQFLRQLDQRPWMWDLVEKGWQTLEGLKEPSFELERRLTGLRPEEVKPRSFRRTLADGTVREFAGGYYPMDYDPRVSREAWAKENNTDIPRTSGVFDRDYYRAATPQGHLIERSEGFARPTSLSIDALTRHVNDATKDIAMREALISAQDILTDSDVRGALLQTVGEGGIKALNSFVRDTANELVVPDGGERAILQALRRSRWGLQQGRYAFNIAAAMRNLPNFANAAVAVPVPRLAAGLLDYVKAPHETEAWVNEKSAEMRNRLLTFERDLSEKLREMEGKTGISQDLQRWAMVPMELTDKLTAYPAWLGSYREGLANGMSEETAIRQADRTVRLNVYAASVMDLPAIMRSPVGKMITLNYNFANMQLNQLFAAISDARSVNPQLRAAGSKRIGMALFWTACVGTIAYELASGRAPTDESGGTSFEPADVAKWGLESAFTEPFMWIPLVRDVAGEMFEGRDANISPLDRPFSAVAKTGRSLWRVVSDAAENGQIDPDLALGFGGHLAEGAGYYFGLPVQQGRATLGYLNAVNEGDEQLGPDAPLGLIWGKKRKGSLREITGE